MVIDYAVTGEAMLEAENLKIALGGFCILLRSAHHAARFKAIQILSFSREPAPVRLSLKPIDQ